MPKVDIYDYDPYDTDEDTDWQNVPDRRERKKGGRGRMRMSGAGLRDTQRRIVERSRNG